MTSTAPKIVIDWTTAEAVSLDARRDDRHEVRARGSDGHWWTVSDSGEMTLAEAETLAASMRTDTMTMVKILGCCEKEENA